jgi:hypothetical protein
MRLNTFAWRVGLSITAIFIFLWYLNSSAALAFPVPPLPDDNLVSNPWFRSATDPTKSALDGWTDAAGQDKYWSSSQKESNPSPDIIVSGVCGFQPVYCGTGARLSTTPGQSGGVAKPGVDSYLYQVVPANSSHRKLTFFTHWVSHQVEIAEVTIYGGNSPNGPWTSLWVPFSHTQLGVSSPSESEPDLWTQTEFLDMTLTTGYSYYRIEIHSRLPPGDQTGFKITGIYFTTKAIGGTAEPSPTANYTGTITPTRTPTKGSSPNLKLKIYLPLIPYSSH